MGFFSLPTALQYMKQAITFFNAKLFVQTATHNLIQFKQLALI